MSINETERIAIVEKLNREEINTQEASEMIGVCPRQVRRIKARYKEEGAVGLIHKSRGKSGKIKIEPQERKRAIRIVNEKYGDFGPTLAHEKLKENHGIKFSKEILRQDMIKEGIWKVKRRRKKTHHPMRDRRECEGELIQIDGSPEDWFEGRGPRCNLNISIDDATSKLMAGFFSPTETTTSHMRLINNHLGVHGRPLTVYADKHSIFRINGNGNGSTSKSDELEMTQFHRALKELDIEIIFANSPQAKGRVERAFQTLQNRLIKEMRLEGISSIEEANKFLPGYIKKYNEKFAVEPTSSKNLHRELLPGTELDRILCFKEERVISKSLTFQYKNVLYQLKVDTKYGYMYRKGKIVIIERLDGNLLFEYMGHDIEVEEVKRNPRSKVITSKEINKVVDKAKLEKPKVYKLKIVGRTFLFGRKPDIFNLP